MIDRNIYKILIDNLNKPEILLLVGARQVGKTTLLKELIKYFKTKNYEYYFFTLEDPQLTHELNKHPENIFKFIPQKDKRIFLLLDEIQLLKNPTNFLKYIYDLYQDKIKIIVAGSSAFYIDQKFKDSLVGRKKVFELYPFSFSEFLLAKGEDILIKKIIENRFFKHNPKESYLVPEKQKLSRLLIEYSQFGGYPRVVLTENHDEKVEYLKELHISFLKKDIYEEGVKEQIKFHQLVKILASQVGNLVNNSELANTLGISNDTIIKYIYILQKSYIVKLCPPFYQNIRKEITKMSKLYFLDNGFRNSILNMFTAIDQRIDSGQMFENLFCSELVKLGRNDIRFWRTQYKKEIDFIIDEKYAFELKLTKHNIKPEKYQRFKIAYPNIKLNFVTYLDNNEFTMLNFLS